MASGKFTIVTNLPQVTGEIRWQSTGNQLQNRSTVTAKLYLMVTGSGLSYSGSRSFTLSVNGNDHKETGTIVLMSGTETLCASHTVTVQHNADGTRQIPIRVQGILYCGTPGLQIQTQGRTVALDPLLRASVLSLPEEGVLGEAVTAGITAFDSSYTHALSWSCAGQSGGAGSADAGTASVLWTPPVSLADACPDAVSALCTVTLRTYADGILIGKREKTIRLLVPESAEFQPSIASFTAAPADAAFYNTWGYVQGGPGALLTVSGAQGAHGSTIVSVSVSGLGDPDPETGVWATGTLKEAGTVSFTAAATDSRGRTTSAECVLAVEAYRAPAALSLRAVRCASDGEERGDGTYVKLTASYLCSAIGGRNTASGMVTCPLWSTGKAVETGVPLVAGGPFALDTSYTLTLTVTDLYGGEADTCTAVVSMAQAIVSITATGKGMGIGKYAAADGLLDVAWPARFGEGITLPNGKSLLSSLSDGSEANLITRNSADNIWIGSASNEAQGNIYLATKASGNAYVSRANVRSCLLDYGIVMKKLWSGSFGPDSNPITVPGIGAYTLFFLNLAGSVTPVLGIREGSALRGVGGYASGSNLWVNTVGLTLSGETLSYTSAAAASINAGGTSYSSGTAIVELYGIL